MAGLNSSCCSLLLLDPVVQVPFWTVASQGRKESKPRKGSALPVQMEAVAGPEEVSTQEGWECPAGPCCAQADLGLHSQTSGRTWTCSSKLSLLESCSRFRECYTSIDTSAPFSLCLSHTLTPQMSLSFIPLSPEHQPCFPTDT